MGDQRKTIEARDNWTLCRWEYDGAPLEARQNSWLELEVTTDGDELVIEHERRADDGYGNVTDRIHIPLWVVRTLLADLPKK